MNFAHDKRSKYLSFSFLSMTYLSMCKFMMIGTKDLSIKIAPPYFPLKKRRRNIKSFHPFKFFISKMHRITYIDSLEFVLVANDLQMYHICKRRFVWLFILSLCSIKTFQHKRLLKFEFVFMKKMCSDLYIRLATFLSTSNCTIIPKSILVSIRCNANQHFGSQKYVMLFYLFYPSTSYEILIG